MKTRNSIYAPSLVLLCVWTFFFGMADVPHAQQRTDETSPTYGEVQKAVKSLQRVDVAWRRIAWKTCLLEGLQASSEAKKPVVLWIFIDRPIDDERC